MLWETAGVCVPIQIIRKQKNQLGENYQLLPAKVKGNSAGGDWKVLGNSELGAG